MLPVRGESAEDGLRINFGAIGAFQLRRHRAGKAGCAQRIKIQVVIGTVLKGHAPIAGIARPHAAGAGLHGELQRIGNIGVEWLRGIHAHGACG